MLSTTSAMFNTGNPLQYTGCEVRGFLKITSSITSQWSSLRSRTKVLQSSYREALWLKLHPMTAFSTRCLGDVLILLQCVYANTGERHLELRAHARSAQYVGSLTGSAIKYGTIENIMPDAKESLSDCFCIKPRQESMAVAHFHTFLF